jgi:MFS family permease
MADERSAKYGWWVTIISALTCFGIYASVTAYSVAVPKIATAIGVSKSDASLGVSVFLVGLALALIVGGMIIDRIGVKKTVLLGMLLLIVPQFLIPMVTDFGLLMLIRFIQGWALISWSAFMVSIMGWIPLKNKGLAAALFLGGSIGGSGIGGLIAGSVIPSMGYGAAFYILGVVPLFFLAIWMVTVKVPPHMRVAPGAEKIRVKRPKPNYGPMLKMPETWALAGIIVANMWLYFGMSGTTAQYGTYLGFSTGDIGALTFSFTPACLIGAVVAGFWADRRAKHSNTKSPIRGRAFVLLVGLVVAMIGSAFIPIISPMGFLAFVGIISFVMFFNAMAQGAYWAIPSETYPKDLRSAGSTFSCGIGSLPKPLAPLVMAVVLAPLWNVAWWTTTIISILGVIGCIMLLRSHIGLKEPALTPAPVSPTGPANGRS